MIEFGEEIAVEGKRPDWLKDDHQKVLRISSEDYNDWEGPARGVGWILTRAIKLPADHPYYRATYAGYKYWPGGEKAPDDWNGGMVLLRDGRTICHGGMSWSHFGEAVGSGDIIGYQQSKGAAIRLEGSTPPPLFEGMTPELIEAMIDAVKAGDLAAAQALVVDPVVLRARELCNNRGFSFDGISEDIRDVIIAALHESNRPPEEKLKAIVRAVVYAATPTHFNGWDESLILPGHYDDTEIFHYMVKAAYNAI